MFKKTQLLTLTIMFLGFAQAIVAALPGTVVILKP